MSKTVTLFQTALRRLADLHTMQKLSVLSGVNRGTLTTYVTGRSRPSIEALQALAKALPPQERAPLLLAHLLDECPALVRGELILEVRPYLIEPDALQEGAPMYGVEPEKDLDALFTALRHLAETRPEVREFLLASLAVMR